MARGSGSAKRQSRTAGTAGDGRTLSTNDNQRAKDDAEQVQLISYVAKLQQYDASITVLQTQIKDLRDERASVVNLAKGTGFKAYELKDIMDDLKKPRTDLAEREERRAKLRSYYGLPAGKREQHEMEPETVRDENFWRAAGYTAGLNGDVADPPAGVGVHHQAWLSGRADGQSRRVMALSKDPNQPITPGSADAPKDDFEATPEELNAQITRQQVQGEKEPAGASMPDWTGYSDNPDDWTDEQVEIFTAWFDALPDETGAENPTAYALPTGVGIAFRWRRDGVPQESEGV